MASFIIDTSVTTQQSLTGSENGLLGQNGSIMVLGASAILTDNNSDLVINGTVASDASAIYSSGTSLELVVGATGNILATGNHGVYANVSSETEILNAGTISGSGTGVTLFSSDTSASHKLINTGTISGETTGVRVEARGQTSTIFNSGTIVGNAYGILSDSITDAVLQVWNTGTIAGNAYSFYGNLDDGSGTSSDRVYNAGLMQGDIALWGGDDIYKGRLGFVSGDITGDDGNDILKGGAGAETLYGGDDDDILSGWGGDDELFGDSGLDILRGDEGDDALSGGSGSDTLYGGKGDDEITTGGGNDVIVFRRKAGDDTITDFNNGKDVFDLQAFNLTNWGGDDELFGDTGEDNLRGDEGDDALSGGSGSDTLNGGKGDDEITTGGGNDVIVFRRKAGDDTITDFNNGKDMIDLQAFNLTNWGDLNGSGAVTDVTGGVEIDFSLIGGSGILTIAGISMGVLGNPDFIF